MKLLALLLAIVPTGLMAQNCAPRDTVVDALTNRYEEGVQSRGLAQAGIVETWGNPETGTFTIAVTLPNGMTCMVASGEAFEILDPVTGEPV